MRVSFYPDVIAELHLIPETVEERRLLSAALKSVPVLKYDWCPDGTAVVVGEVVGLKVPCGGVER